MRHFWIYILVLSLVALIAIVEITTTNNKDITIGAILPLTGDVASYGVAVRQGIEVAVDKVNNEGGVNNKSITIIYEDDKADPKEGLAAAKKLISINRVNAIIGAVPSSVTLAIAPTAESSKVVLLSPASSSPKITNQGDYIFRNYPSDELEGRLVAEFAIAHNYSNAAVITINNDYGIGLNKVFCETFLQSKGKVIINETFLEGTTDFRTLLSKVKASNPDSIFIVGYSKELGTMVKQAKELGINSQFLSTVNFYDNQSIIAGGTAVEGVIFSSPVFDTKSPATNVQEFVASFKKRFGQEPDVWSAHGYDALLLLVEAMRTKGITSEDIKEGLYAIKNYPGVSGVTTFDKNGDVFKKAKFLTVRSGEFVPYQ